MNRRREQREANILCARYLDRVRGRTGVALSQSRSGHHLSAENFRHEFHPSDALSTEMKPLAKNHIYRFFPPLIADHEYLDSRLVTIILT